MGFSLVFQATTGGKLWEKIKEKNNGTQKFDVKHFNNEFYILLLFLNATPLVVDVPDL